MSQKEKGPYYLPYSLFLFTKKGHFQFQCPLYLSAFVPNSFGFFGFFGFFSPFRSVPRGQRCHYWDYAQQVLWILKGTSEQEFSKESLKETADALRTRTLSINTCRVLNLELTEVRCRHLYIFLDRGSVIFLFWTVFMTKKGIRCFLKTFSQVPRLLGECYKVKNKLKFLKDKRSPIFPMLRWHLSIVTAHVLSVGDGFEWNYKHFLNLFSLTSLVRVFMTQLPVFWCVGWDLGTKASFCLWMNRTGLSGLIQWHFVYVSDTF